jgi:hypothetical protein
MHVEHRKIVLQNNEKLIAQLSSRRKLYDSKGRERLESKADMRARGLESPDRADALIGGNHARDRSPRQWCDRGA